MKIGCWQIAENDLNDIIADNGICPNGFNLPDLAKLVEMSLHDRAVGEGDPWRMGKLFHIKRAIDVMKLLDITTQQSLNETRAEEMGVKDTLPDWVILEK